MNMIKIAPSILSADFAALAASAERARGADLLHVDVMDGVFVPNITLGPAVVAALRGKLALPFDVHLMIADPEAHIASFVAAGANIITVHAESTVHLHRALQMIKEAGLAAGISLNPATPPCVAAEVIDIVDMILVMTVNPGFGGQTMIPSTLRKVSIIRDIVASSGRHVDIEVDGGINELTVVDAVKAGANVIVAGSYVFDSDDPAAAVERLRKAALAARDSIPAR
ncbi:MAG: Ribulose-phosphate 3-epimerase [Firmicutes bacterium ADurb.Bin506]|jgi:ribulose-phosphate 3-epimerase|nr:MAG: Ribulose-phosphate 3-epimerase [Firmicutes bacterium ADurb.Bin506]